MSKDLILLLGDQLSPDLPSLKAAPDAAVLMAEVMDEATYVKHHPKKIAFVFSAMRHFADDLRAAGRDVRYVTLEDPKNAGSLSGEVARAIAATGATRMIVTEPGEHRLLAAMRGWGEELSVEVEIVADDRFISSHKEFGDWAAGRKQLRMEFFYREMRRKTGLLMDGDNPAGGAWNYDAENRKPPKDDLFMSAPVRVEPDAITSEVLSLVKARFADHFGDIEPFWFAVSARDAEAALDHFITEALPQFGDYQDAMIRGRPFMYHSLLSLYINAGLLDPLAVCRRVEMAYLAGDAPLNAAEGFIRQIIGWREYVRGVYWREGPEYLSRNVFGAARSLPEFYWSGETRMTCLREAITQTKEEAYAHHIQRLMITGNFAMLVGADPHEVHEWYLAVYADAYEWVEAPNTIGMSQFADGGLLGSKPYAAGGAYINRMSDYCSECVYKVSKKTGEGACPFNYLYWDFLARNEDVLRGNPRLGPAYRTWDRMADRQAEYRSSAAQFLDALE